MAESDKPDSSTGKAKSKMSFLDEDISKDFLSSWKSMSDTGGDDIDFNFGPVTKGKNKAFDFGMDMDFSLDDAFGKMPSFKLDMPDIDFSSSPKRSSKSKEKKSEEESAEGSRQDQDDKFTFSFDFDGNGDGKEIGEIRPKMVADPMPDTGEAKKGGLHLLDNRKTSVDVKSGDDASSEGSEQKMHDDPSSCGKDSKELMKQDVAVEDREKNNDKSRDDDNIENGGTRNKKDVESVSLDGHVEKNQLHSLNNRKMTIDSKPSRDKESSFAEAFGKMPPLKVNMPIIDFYGSSKKYLKIKENLSDLESAKGNCQEKNNKLPSPPHLTKKISAAPITEEQKVIGVVETQGDDNMNTVACSATNISKPMNSEVTSNAAIERSGLKDFPAPSDSQPTQAKPRSMLSQVSEANNFSKFKSTNDGAETKLPMVDRKKKDSTLSRAADSGDNPSSKKGGPKLDNNPTSCGNELSKQESTVEKRAKDADVSRGTDSNANEDTRTNIIVQPVPSEEQASKDELHLLHNPRMSRIDKASGIRLPSLGAPKGASKSSNQGNEKQGKMSSMSTVMKSSVGQGRQVNRLPLARIDKKMPTLPSLGILRNITPNKQASPNILQDPNIMENLEKSPRLQVKTKMDSSVNRTQTPVSFLKRKPTEAADVHPSKRHSPSESRYRKLEVSATEVENKVQIQGSLMEEPKNIAAENQSPKFDFRLEANMENVGFTLMAEGDVNVEKAEACAKELDDICSMLKKKHGEAKELLVRALVNNNNLLMLNHPISDEKIREVQRFASRLMSREQEAGV